MKLLVVALNLSQALFDAHLGLESLLQFSHLHLGVTRIHLGSLTWGQI